MEVVRGKQIKGKGDVVGKGARRPAPPVIKRRQIDPKGRAGRPKPPGSSGARC